MAKSTELRQRTLAFAVAVCELCKLLPPSYQARHVGGQMFRSATAVAANYRSACRARSKPDFISKLGLVIEEGDETDFWLEFSVAAGLLKPGAESRLCAEANELIAIFTQGQRTAKANLGRE